MYVHLFIFIFSAIGKISIADENTSCLEMIENEFNFGEDFSENIQNLILVNLNDDLSCQSFIEYLSLKLRESTHSYWKELDEQGRRRIASHLLPLLKYQILNGTNGPVKSIIEAIGFENIFGPREINCSQQIKQTFDLSHSLSENLIDHLNLSNHKECRQFIKISKNYLFDRVQLINRSEWLELSDDNKKWLFQSLFPITYVGFQRSRSQIPLSLNMLLKNMQNLTLFDGKISLNEANGSLSNKTIDNSELPNQNSSMNFVYFLLSIVFTIGLFYSIRSLGLISYFDRY
nr:uncharacterized protein LOC124492830 [Dermatophagoides farinae]